MIRLLVLLFAMGGIALAQVAQDERAKTQAEAEAGDVEAAFMLGRMYRDGVGGAQDEAEARVWLKQAADAGHVRASVLLGLMLMAGQGGDADFPAARPYLLYAAAAGDEDGLYAMGLQFMEAPPKVSAPEPATAIFWFRQAAAKGSIDAVYKLGFMSLRGIGTPADAGEAYRWLLKAAEAGDPQAQIIVATMLNEGQGVEKNPRAALVWYYRAKANGMVDDDLEVELLKQVTEDEAKAAKSEADALPGGG